MSKLRSMLFFVNPIIDMIKFISQQYSRKKERRLKESIKIDIDNKKAAMAGQAAALKAKMAYENQRELNNRP